MSIFEDPNLDGILSQTVGNLPFEKDNSISNGSARTVTAAS